VTPDQLDTDPYLLNFLNGTVDLRTGALRPHRRKDLITKLIHYKYRANATCPLWLTFLDRIMGGGPDASEGGLERASRFTDYLQRAFGYSLTGCTIEKAVFIPFGPSNAGKSTMLDTIRHLAKEYSVLLQADTLMVRQESNNTLADLADLRGARFAQTSETEEGHRLAQSKLKRISQGMGEIKATRKYENPITFPETHKLWIDTNRKPTIPDGDDQATFNRLHPIPFTVEIPLSERDKGLRQKLNAEGEGILAWVVLGAKLWHESGLNHPDEVDRARNQWREASDQIGHFIEERCIVGNSCLVRTSALYGAYRRWAEEAGEKNVVNNTTFRNRMQNHGYQADHKREGDFYLGLGLLDSERDRE